VVTDRPLTLSEVAGRAGVSSATLRRWASSGVIPTMDGGGEGWTPSAAAQARVVARLRERGHSLDEIRRATGEGQLALAPG
jgi:adenylate cyclase